MQETPNQKRSLGKSTIFIVLSLLGLLAAASTILVFGEESSTSFPSISNSKPSGLRAFAELLQADGYSVVIDLSSRPKAQPQDTIIAIDTGEDSIDFASTIQGLDNETPLITQSIQKHQKAGGKVVKLAFPPDFASATKSAKKVSLTDSEINGTLTTSGDDQITSNFTGGGTPIAKAKEDVYINLQASQSKFTTLYIHDALGMSNRFLDADDNAQIYLQTFRQYIPKSSKIIFAEATFGNVSEPTLTSDLGNWSVVAFRQFLFLSILAAIGIGIRFGFPVPTPVRERGVSELLGAMGGVLRRSRSHDQAMMILLDDTYDRIRESIRAPLGSSPADLIKDVPPPLALAITKIRQNYGQKLKTKDWLQMSTDLEHALSEFESNIRAQTSKRSTLQ